MLVTATRSALFLAVIAATAAAQAGGATYEKRWIYSMHNLQVRESADEVIALIERGAKAGYNGVVISDYKLTILDRVPDFYFDNVRRVQEAAKKHGVELVPCVAPFGYSSGMLAHDPNLAEGLPVRDAPFVTRGGVAVPAPGSTPGAIRNGGMEEARGDALAGMGFQDDPGKVTFVDASVKHSGARSARIEASAPGENRRLSQKVAVRPWTAYRLSAWVKTEGLRPANAFRLLAIGSGSGEKNRQLTFFEGGVKSDQDWTRVEVIFNSLDFDAAQLYVGVWGKGQGRAWVDDWSLEDIGLINVLRRDGCPLTITSGDGQTRYEEGRDFEPVIDPKLGRVPYDGVYSFDHEPPAIRIKAGSKIQDGQALRVSWYHPVLVHGEQIMICPSEEKTYAILRDQLERVEALYHPKTVFLGFDEIRVLNWCDACQRRKLDAGPLLADCLDRTLKLVHAISPQAEAVAWSDMFDPNHNAVKDYYLVRGDLAGSWKALPSTAIIANWNGGKKEASLRFFADRGNRQVLAGYYDADDLSGFTDWDRAGSNVRGVVGFLYTTWERKYGLLESYGKAIEGR
jgi:hypothetical protein